MNKIALYVGLGVAGLAVVVGASMLATYLVVSRVQPAASSAPYQGGSVPAAVDLADGKSKIVVVGQFTTNLADQDRPRYISVTFQIVVRDEAVAKQLEANLPVVRDSVLGILNKKKSQEVTGETGANSLKNDVQEAINKLMGGPYVQKVLMTDFVVQY